MEAKSQCGHAWAHDSSGGLVCLKCLETSDPSAYQQVLLDEKTLLRAHPVEYWKRAIESGANK